MRWAAISMGCLKRLYILIQRHIEEVALENPNQVRFKKSKRKKTKN
jgi:hypothetical protein